MISAFERMGREGEGRNGVATGEVMGVRVTQSILEWAEGEGMGKNG